MKTRFFFVPLTLCLLLLGLPGAALAQVSLKLGHGGALNHHSNQACEKFVDAVKQKSNGEIDIKIFPSNQLGNPSQLVEDVQRGTVDMMLSSDLQLSPFIEVFSVLNLPYLFRDMSHVAKAMDGPAGDVFSKEAEKKGVIVLGYWENGFRHISNSKRPIKKPEDLNGLTLRTSNSPFTQAAFKALGAQPTLMSATDLYIALARGSKNEERGVDGQESPIDFILGFKLVEVQKFLSLTGHQHSVAPLCMSKAIFDSLKSEHKKILLEEGRAHALVSRKMATDSEAKQLEELEMLVNTVADMQAFSDACKPVYDDARKKYGSIVDQILALK